MQRDTILFGIRRIIEEYINSIGFGGVRDVDLHKIVNTVNPQQDKERTLYCSILKLILYYSAFLSAPGKW